jgi:hypothetical protein
MTGTFANAFEVAQDAERRRRRVVLLLEGLFVVATLGALLLDRLPSAPYVECHVAHAAMRSHYPHPFGEPPDATWTVCAWVR